MIIEFVRADPESPFGIRRKAKCSALPLLISGLFSFLLNSGLGASIPNDYDADGKSDLAVYDLMTADWYILSANNRVIKWHDKWGFAGCTPISGDYDGDGQTDMAVYYLAPLWFAKTVDNKSLMWNIPGAYGINFAGDYLRLGKDQACTYTYDGIWYVGPCYYTNDYGDAHFAFNFATNWGYSGCMPVTGDYNGDGRDDLAVFDEKRGDWYILDISNNVALAWHLHWGYNGCVPVAGDYDNDGKSDLAVYDPLSGKWYIWSLTKGPLVWGDNWGFANGVPVPGDYDGHGSDMAIYDVANGAWYIKTINNTVIAWGKQWGYKEAWPVGASPMATVNVAGDWYFGNNKSKTPLTLTQAGSHIEGNRSNDRTFSMDGWLYGTRCIIKYTYWTDYGAVSWLVLSLEFSGDVFRGKSYSTQGSCRVVDEFTGHR